MRGSVEDTGLEDRQDNAEEGWRSAHWSRLRPGLRHQNVPELTQREPSRSEESETRRNSAGEPASKTHGATSTERTRVTGG